ncbi:hypothetical protein [Egbenema bharatensis]|uniref:hypothetical protein n=1 Tax=Egbenema bharatensis TaxID=3463334 RepID=UPI003A8A2C25
MLLHPLEHLQPTEVITITKGGNRLQRSLHGHLSHITSVISLAGRLPDALSWEVQL